MPETEDGQERVIMKITGVLVVDLLIEIDPGRYGSYIVFENGTKALCVKVLKALYGMLIAALLWYRQFKTDLEKVGFKFNSYDPCVENRKVNGKTQTVTFLVDDLKSSLLTHESTIIFSLGSTTNMENTGRLRLPGGRCTITSV
jgi:hypothetical protein